ncbi:MAG TPA: hypothetical protein VF942_18885 [Acidimicrobiales bacterium]
MRTLARAGVLAVLVASLSSVAASVAATTSKLPELPVSDLLTPAGKLTGLHSGVTYQASEFPVALRMTAPDASWSGAQWKSQSDRYGGGPPFYGWASVGQGSFGLPRGLLLIMTAYARTPSVASTVAGLRTRGVGATYQATSPVKLAGFSGLEFDGQVVATRHTFVPFSPRSHGAKYFPDAYFMNQGEAFRIIVLNVRGKTVVVFLDSVLSADQFPAFLIKADRILKSLRFPT